MLTLLIEKNDRDKLIDIWLKRGEAAPSLTDLRHSFPGYQVVLFRSGDEDLAQTTAELLRHNLAPGPVRV